MDEQAMRRRPFSFADLRTPGLVRTLAALAAVVALACLVAPDRGGGGWRAAALAAIILGEAGLTLAPWLEDQDGISARIAGLMAPMWSGILRLPVYLAFLFHGWMPAWMLFIIFASELSIPYVRTFVRQAGRRLDARPSGRIAAVVQAASQLLVIAIALALPAHDLARSPIVAVVLVAALLSALYALFDHIAEARRLVEHRA